VHVKEIKDKISGMKESFEKSKHNAKHDHAGRAYKFSLYKEKYFKKYSRATRELNDKKEMFTKKCQLNKEKRGKISLASAAYSEQLNKKQCTKTRRTSEVNNKGAMKYFEKSIASFKSRCEDLSRLRKERGNSFIYEVCEGVHHDVQASIAKVMKSMKSVGKPSKTQKSSKKH